MYNEVHVPLEMKIVLEMFQNGVGHVGQRTPWRRKSGLTLG